MKPSQKSNRSRGKSHRSKSLGNVVNRVFESAGPEGKVRGTPQQIIDKYEQLARDAQTSGDRVMAENFLQHAEHYARILSSAQAEQQARREEQQQQPQQAQQPQQKKGGGDQPAQSEGGGESGAGGGGSGGGLETIETREDGSPLVATPETPGEQQPGQEGAQGQPQGKKPSRRRRSRRGDKGGAEGGEAGASDGAGGEAEPTGSTETVSG